MERNLDYLDFWNLRRPPFEMDADPEFFFESKTHSEALARMIYLVSDRGMGLGALTGEIGSGKTLTLKTLCSRIDKEDYRVIRLVTAAYPFEHILEEMVAHLADGQPHAMERDKYHLTREFQSLLQTKIADIDKHLVVILDESQFLSPECLEDLKCLTNINHEQEKSLLTIIFGGQPELKGTIRALPQVYQRVGMYYHLGNLAKDELPAYVRHRLQVAGAEDIDVFDEDCFDLLYDFSLGCPRQINRVCKLVIDRACILKKREVTREMLEIIVDDIRKHFG